MNQVLKKMVLISPEQGDAQLGTYFQNLGLQITSDYNKDHPEQYAFIIDDFLPELRFLPRIQTKEQILKKCLPDVRAHIDTSKLEHPSVHKLLAGHLSFEGPFDLIDKYSSEFKNILSIKIHDYLNVGYFIDTIIVEAYKASFPINEIRTYLNSALPYSLREMEKLGDFSPVEVSFSYCEEGFVLQLNINVLNENIKNDLRPSTDLLKSLKESCNYIDISLFKKRNKLIISSMWFKEESLRNFHSYFFTEVNVKNGNDVSLLTVIDEKNEAIFDPVVQLIATENNSIKVRGGHDFFTEFQRVLGTKEPEDFFVARISGSNSEDDWKQIIPEVTQKLNEEVIKIRARNEEVTPEAVIRIMGEEIKGSDPDAVKTFVKSLIEETEQKIELKKLQPDPQKEKLEGQVQRMKKVIEQMKGEIIRLRSMAQQVPKDEVEVVVGEQPLEVLDLKKSLVGALENVRSKERTIKKIKSDMEQIISAKDIKIETLESKIDELKNGFVQSREFANEEKLEMLQAENKSLQARLDLANRKINIISANMDKQDSGQHAKKDKEISNLKSSVQMAQAIIDKLNKERDEIESKLAEERERVSKLREDKIINEEASKSLAEKDKQLFSTASEKKIIEEKFRAQTIELKKLEQKLKFTSAQLEEAQKRKGAQGGQGVTKSNDIYIKQLEHANTKLAEVSSDLAEKKRELLKLKQENSVLTSKALELERKLGIADKKAS